MSMKNLLGLYRPDYTSGACVNYEKMDCAGIPVDRRGYSLVPVKKNQKLHDRVYRGDGPVSPRMAVPVAELDNFLKRPLERGEIKEALQNGTILGVGERYGLKYETRLIEVEGKDFAAGGYEVARAHAYRSRRLIPEEAEVAREVLIIEEYRARRKEVFDKDEEYLKEGEERAAKAGGPLGKVTVAMIERVRKSRAKMLARSDNEILLMVSIRRCYQMFCNWCSICHDMLEFENSYTLIPIDYEVALPVCADCKVKRGDLLKEMNSAFAGTEV